MKRFFALVAFLSTSSAAAQPGTEAPDGGAPVGTLTRAPVLVRSVEARYPEGALDAGLTGTVVMEIDLSDTGGVTDARVVESAGPDFDAAALEAVHNFEFSPAEVDGKPAPVRIVYSYQFLFRQEVVEAPLPEDVVNFSGTLLERGTRVPLRHATVAIGWGDRVREATSGEDGTFRIHNVPAGLWPVVVTAEGYTRYEVQEEIREKEATVVTYFVRRAADSPYETVVVGQRERKEVARVSLRQEEIRLVPGTQGDALKVVQNLPGVARAPFSMGLLIVRGGKPWDTRVYVDETPIPLLFHFGGLYATFNSNLLEEINFEPGNFDAEHGRSIGGLVTAKTRTPSKEGVHGYVDVNLIDTSLLVETPVNERWSVAVGARRSYIDVLLPLAIDLVVPQANALSFTVAPRYYDYQIKAERREKNSQDRFFVSFFGSNDRLAFLLPNPAFDPEGRSNFETLLSYNRLAAHWEKRAGPSLSTTTHATVGFDQFNFGSGDDLYFRTTLYPTTVRQAFDLEAGRMLTLTFGADLFLLPYTYSTQGPPRFKFNQIPDPFLSRQLIREDRSTLTFEPGLFLDVVLKPAERLKLVPSVRADYDSLMRDGWLDPRFSAFLKVADRTTLKGAVGLFHQPPDYRQGLLSPKFGNPDLLPEGAIHTSVGVEQAVTEVISIDLQGFYKSLFHQSQATLAPPAGTEATVDTVDLRYTSTGVGRTFGGELLIRHQLSRNFFGWIAYSLSRAERIYAGHSSYDLHPLDQPHNLVAVASYQLPYDFVLGAKVRYASGALNTPANGAIYDVNGNYYYPLYRSLFSRRLPAFFQADVRLDKRFVFERWMLALYADVQNVTNRQNVEGVVNNFDYTDEQYLHGLPILPSLGVRGEF